MRNQGSTFSTSEANTYFQSILAEVEKAIVFRLRTVALARGKGRKHPLPEAPAANDNARPLPPEPPAGTRAAPPSGERSERESKASANAPAAHALPATFRSIRPSEVRAILLRDSDLHADILFAVYQDFTRAVEKGTFKGAHDRALVFEIVRCRTIKAARSRASGLLRTVLTDDGSPAIDQIADQAAETPDEAPDRRRALLHLRPVLERLSDDEQTLLVAKFEGTLIELARQRGENPVTMRSRAKRLHDRIICESREALGANAPIAA